MSGRLQRPDSGPAPIKNNPRGLPVRDGSVKQITLGTCQFETVVRNNIVRLYSAPGVEIFVFHWGCTRLGALRDDQRGPTIYARDVTEPVFPLQDMFFANTRTYLFLATRRFVPPGMKSTLHASNLQAMKYSICFSNRLNALSPAKTVECPRKLRNDSIYI